METKELKIQVPDGFEIDKEKSTFEKIVFKEKDTKPRSWEEYCDMFEGQKVWFIDNIADINTVVLSSEIGADENRNTLPTEQMTKAFLAMMQLMSLRQAWIHIWSLEEGLTKDWEPDWKNVNPCKYCISGYADEFDIHYLNVSRKPLSFPTIEMATDFMNCFKDLLEIAKPLI